jgi:hypothetical protein
MGFTRYSIDTNNYTLTYPVRQSAGYFRPSHEDALARILLEQWQASRMNDAAPFIKCSSKSAGQDWAFA